MATLKEVLLEIDAYEPAEGDPPLADLLPDREPGAREKWKVVTGETAVTLPSPKTVLRLGSDTFNNPAVVSVGEPAILSAPGGAGKSYAVLSIMVAAANGDVCADRDVFTVRAGAFSSALGFELRRGPMVFVSLEESINRIGVRLKAIKATPDALKHMHFVDNPSVLFDPVLDRSDSGAQRSAGFDALEGVIRDVRPSLVAIDPISAVMGSCGLNDPTAARSAVRALAKLSTDTGCGLLLVAHDTKAARGEARAGGSPGAGAVSGSGQWFDSVRSVLYLNRKDDGGISIESLKANNGRSGWSQPIREIGVDVGETYAGFVADGPATSAYEKRKATNVATTDTHDDDAIQ